MTEDKTQVPAVSQSAQAQALNQESLGQAEGLAEKESKDTNTVSAKEESASDGEGDYSFEEADILEEELPIIEIGSQSASGGAIGSQQSTDREPKPEDRKGEEKR